MSKVLKVHPPLLLICDNPVFNMYTRLTKSFLINLHTGHIRELLFFICLGFSGWLHTKSAMGTFGINIWIVK